MSIWNPLAANTRKLGNRQASSRVTLLRICQGFNPGQSCKVGETSRYQKRLYHGDDCCHIIPGTGADCGFQKAVDLIDGLSCRRKKIAYLRLFQRPVDAI